MATSTLERWAASWSAPERRPVPMYCTDRLRSSWSWVMKSPTWPEKTSTRRSASAFWPVLTVVSMRPPATSSRVKAGSRKITTSFQRMRRFWSMGLVASRPGRSAQCAGRPDQGVLDDLDQDHLGRVPHARVAQDHRHVVRQHERLAHVLRLVGHLAVEAVDGDHEGQLALLEIVDGGEAVGQAAGVDQHDRPDRAAAEVVPHEPEA